MEDAFWKLHCEATGSNFQIWCGFFFGSWYNFVGVISRETKRTTTQFGGAILTKDIPDWSFCTNSSVIPQFDPIWGASDFLRGYHFAAGLKGTNSKGHHPGGPPIPILRHHLRTSPEGWPGPSWGRAPQPRVRESERFSRAMVMTSFTHSLRS